MTSMKDQAYLFPDKLHWSFEILLRRISFQGQWSAGDFITVSFDMATDRAASAGDKAFVDRLLRIDPPLGTDYSGEWVDDTAFGAFAVLVASILVPPSAERQIMATWAAASCALDRLELAATPTAAPAVSGCSSPSLIGVHWLLLEPAAVVLLLCATLILKWCTTISELVDEAQEALNESDADDDQMDELTVGECTSPATCSCDAPGTGASSAAHDK